jgi:predicted nucleotidyltransferase
MHCDSQREVHSLQRTNIVVPRQQLNEFCRKHGIRKLAFYGSVLRDDFAAGSDIDVLVEFQPGRVHGLAIIDIERELTAILGGQHKVDIVSEKFLNPRLRDRILETAEVQYAER